MTVSSARWDATRAKKTSQPTRIDRRCIECGRDSSPRYLYCSDGCSERSRAKIRQARSE